MAEQFPLDTKADRIKYLRECSRELSASADALNNAADTFVAFDENEVAEIKALTEAVEGSLKGVIYNTYCLTGFDL